MPYQSQIAVPLPADDHIHQVLGAGYHPETALNVVKMLAGTDDMCAATLGLVKAVFSAEGVDPKLRQVIILRAAKVLDAPYEWQANVPMSLNNGLTQAEVDMIGVDGPVQGLPENYTLLCTAADEMYTAGTLEDATLRKLLDAHGETIARKLILILA